MAALIQSSIIPKCTALGGGVYVLTGAGRLGAAEDGDEACQAKPLWTAACCAPPEGKSGFSVGLIKETEEAERQVSMKELEEMLGVEELFSEGCGGEDRETAAAAEGLHTDALHTNAAQTDVNSETVDPHADLEESSKDSTPGERVGADAKSEDSDLSEETAAESVISVSSRVQQYSKSVPEDDSNSTSTLLYVLSTTLSILKAPLRPVFSTVTEFPAQVMQHKH